MRRGKHKKIGRCTGCRVLGLYRAGTLSERFLLLMIPYLCRIQSCFPSLVSISVLYRELASFYTHAER